MTRKARKVSRSFVRCGVLDTYLFHIPCAMAAASVLFALLERAGGAAVEVVVVVVDGAPLGVVARCFGAIFVCKSCRRHQVLGAGGQDWR
jgi:hypothetical protein